MTMHHLWVDAECAPAGAASACEYLYCRIGGSGKEVVLLVQVLLYELGSEGDVIHIGDMGHRIGPGKAAICMEA